jgi:hypothetical protein
MREVLSIDRRRFNNDRHIANRTLMAETPHRGALRSALLYLYMDNGPRNLPRKRLLLAAPYLEVAECLVARWLYTRTNGRLRSQYGAAALIAARTSRYRCSECNFADVRVLNLDHIDGRIIGTGFACLCANCHTIKSRKSDWTGTKLLRATP